MQTFIRHPVQEAIWKSIFRSPPAHGPGSRRTRGINTHMGFFGKQGVRNKIIRATSRMGGLPHGGWEEKFSSKPEPVTPVCPEHSRCGPPSGGNQEVSGYKQDGFGKFQAGPGTRRACPFYPTPGRALGITSRPRGLKQCGFKMNTFVLWRIPGRAGLANCIRSIAVRLGIAIRAPAK
jgi:hypothetical protein